MNKTFAECYVVLYGAGVIGIEKTRNYTRVLKCKWRRTIKSEWLERRRWILSVSHVGTTQSCTMLYNLKAVENIGNM